MSETLPETGGMPEQRGDFMLLPPLMPTFGVPSLIQQLPREFLVTRRRVAVSTEPVGHTIDASLTGRVPGRARRRMRFAADDLEHFIPPMDDEWVDEELSAPTAPARTSSPRSRAAARPRSSQRPPLPSRRDVHRSVSSPPPARRPASTSETSESARESAPETIPGELMAPQMPPSTFPGVGDSSSVVRRRGGGVLSAPSSEHTGTSPTPEESAPHESGPQEPGLRASSEFAPPMTPASMPIPALEATPTPGTGATPGVTDADSALVHAPASSRVQDRTDAPPLQRRRSRGRINTPIVPDEDDSDLPPAVKKMLEEIDDLQAGAPVPTLQGEPASLPSNDGTSLPNSLPSNVESPSTSRTSVHAQAPDSVGAREMDLVHRVDATHDAPASTTASPAPASSPEAVSSPRTPASPVPSQDVTPPVTPSPRDSSVPGAPSALTTAPVSDVSPSISAARESSRPMPTTPNVEDPSSRSFDPPPPSSRTGSAVPAQPRASVPRPTATTSRAAAEFTDVAQLADLLNDSDGSTQAPTALQASPRASTSRATVTPSRDPVEGPEVEELAHLVESASTPSGRESAPGLPVQSPPESSSSIPAREGGLVEQQAAPVPAGVTSAVSKGSFDDGPASMPSARSAPASDIETRVHGIVADADGGGTGVGASSSPTPSVPVSNSWVDAPATSLRATTVGTRGTATIPSARGGEAKSAEIRPVLAGRTGIQRRARSRPAPAGSARDTVPSGLAGFTGTPTPRVAGPRRVEVPEQVKQALRSSVGEPPTHVTVHEGDHAADMTGAVNAEAFTRDGQIYLAGDAPLTSTRGQELLAHELTHVMQQGGRNGSMPGEHTREGQDLEGKALAVEQVMASGARETIAPKALARPARDVEHPELHHRHDGGVREAPSRSSWASPPVPQSRPQEVVISQPMGMSPDVQRRERDLRSSALSRGLGAVGSALEQGLVSSVEQEVLGPPAATKDKDSRYKRLERQAADLYPYIRARLRAELVRDRERRGRIARDWS